MESVLLTTSILRPFQCFASARHIALPFAVATAMALAVGSASAVVVNDFNNFSGFQYTFDGFQQATGSTAARLRDLNDSYGGAGIIYNTPRDYSASINEYLEVDYFLDPGHGASNFIVEFYDGSSRSVKYTVPTPLENIGTTQTYTLQNTFGSPANGVGDFANFDYTNITSFGILGQFGGTAPFDVSFDEVRFNPTGPPPVEAYGGQSATAAWRAEAQTRIDQNRKADLDIVFTRANGDPISGADVRIVQQEHAFGFGSAVGASELTKNSSNDVIYRQKVEELFNTATIETALKWPAWEGEYGTDFAQFRSQASLDWLASKDIDARGHAMVWPSWEQLPADLRALENDPPALAQAVLDHIQDIGSATDGKVVHWDVVNEPRTNHDLMDILGDDVLDDWFAAAKLANDAQLFLNEFGIITGDTANTAQRAEFLAEIQGLQARGAPIEGIGVQGHFRPDDLTDIPRVWTILDDFANATGLPIAITEFDFETTDQTLQAEYLRDFMTAVFAHDAVDEFVMWGFWEGAHWRPDAALFNQDWTIKPAGQAFIDLVYGEWWTDESLVLDANGELSLRVFQGEHRIEVDVDGETLIFDIVVDDAGYTLSQVLGAILEGDYNGDGFVSQADLDLVLLNWGQDSSADIPAGWINDLPDSAISQNELDGVLLNWGSGSGASSVVPEPTTAAGLMLLIYLLSVVRVGRTQPITRRTA